MVLRALFAVGQPGGLALEGIKHISYVSLWGFSFKQFGQPFAQGQYITGNSSCCANVFFGKR